MSNAKQKAEETIEKAIERLDSKQSIYIDLQGLNDEQITALKLLLKQEQNKTAAFKALVDSYIKNTGKHGKTGMRDTTHDKIDAIVKHQMQINAATDKTVTVGYGDKAKQVKYEQRSFTPKWIMDNAQAQLDSVKEYLNTHKDEINQHHKEVLGLDAVTDADKLKNLNRSTAKAWYSVQISELVKRTGGSKDDCESALKFNNWNADKAFEFMQKLGQVKQLDMVA